MQNLDILMSSKSRIKCYCHIIYTLKMHSCLYCWKQTLRKNEPRHDKTNKVSVRPAKTQISLGIRPGWSESSLGAVSSLSAWRNIGSLATHWGHSEDCDQTGRMPWLIWVFAGHTLILLVLSCRGSKIYPGSSTINGRSHSRALPFYHWIVKSIYMMI